MAKGISAFLFSIVLTVGLLPLPAVADESATESTVQLEPGTYVEHEAIAYVTDGGARARAFSLESDLVDSAETLMAVDADAASEALGEDGDDAGIASSARMRTLSREDVSDDSAGRLILVHDESKIAGELIAALEEDERVAFAEPNRLVDRCDEGACDGEKELGSAYGEDSSASSSSESDTAGEIDDPDSSDGLVLPDQPSESEDFADSAAFAADADAPAADMTSFQWGMSNDGAMGGVLGGDAVDMEYGAWKEAASSGDWETAAIAECKDMEEVVVAVIDNGVDETNPDLADVLWDEGCNYPQLTALGGDVHGMSTVPGTTSTAPISADCYHGTHVAGIIAAEWNGEGVSGVAPNVRIMSLRSNVDTFSEMLACVNYVVEAARAGVNVRIANCSWGMGANASRALDVAFTQLGVEGVATVFASGNSDSDMDATMNTVSTLRDNPYVVTVDSVDASGALSMFSCYGQATTDVVAPGSTILSTYPTSAQQYLGEIDSEAALYESFDEKTHADDGAGIEGGEPVLSFKYTGLGGEASVVGNGLRFDGEASLELVYDVEAADALDMGGLMAVQSTGVDLSGLSEKPRYLSIRAISVGMDGETCAPQILVSVKTTDGGASEPLEPVSQFGIGGGSWSGQYVELPENTDFEDFHLVVYYMNAQVSILGGQKSFSPIDGSVYIDSIGLGNELVPYQYSQGTSMAAPAVSGAMAVMAGLNPDDSAAQLAARAKGAAQSNDYDDVCSTGGYATVDGADDPAPVPVSAGVSEDGACIAVCGYFVPEDVQVSIGGEECAVLSRNDAAGGVGDGERVELTVRAPEGFAGGEAWVELRAAGKRGRLLVDFGRIVQSGQGEGSSSQEEGYANLPVPEELDDWGNWQLVGFAGTVYALPRANEFDSDVDRDFFLKYDPDSREWSRVALPSDDQLEAAGVKNVASMSGATYQGSLIIQISGRDHVEGDDIYISGSYWRYTVEGEWERLAVSLPDDAMLGLSALGSDGENLYVFGGVGTYGYLGEGGAASGDVNTIFRLDLDAGAAEPVGELIRARCNAQIAYRDGAFLVAGGQNSAAQEGVSMGVERVRVFDEKTSAVSPSGEMADYSAGVLSSIPVRMSLLVSETGQLAFAPAAVAEGFMVVGPRSDSGATDTYTLANEDGALPSEYDKYASYLTLLNPSALAYDGELYVLAATTSGEKRVFGSTPVSTVAQPGDYVVPDSEPFDPVSGSSDEVSGFSGETLETLAGTGDSATVPFAILAVVPVAAGAVAAGARMRGRMRR